MNMSNYADRINPTDCGIYTYLDDLEGKKYQIPTFQREIVWGKRTRQETVGQHLQVLSSRKYLAMENGCQIARSSAYRRAYYL
jgi:hypothetical protein